MDILIPILFFRYFFVVFHRTFFFVYSYILYQTCIHPIILYNTDNDYIFTFLLCCFIRIKRLLAAPTVNCIYAYFICEFCFCLTFVSATTYYINNKIFKYFLPFFFCTRNKRGRKNSILRPILKFNLTMARINCVYGYLYII